MTAARFESIAENGSTRITLGGEMDLANAAAVEDEIRAAVSNKPTTVSVDGLGRAHLTWTAPE
jgi:anti-anti-sigma regulatory factor